MDEIKEAVITWLKKEKPPRQPMPVTEAAAQIAFFICATVMLAIAAALFFFTAVCY